MLRVVVLRVGMICSTPVFANELDDMVRASILSFVTGRASDGGVKLYFLDGVAIRLGGRLI